MLPQSARDPILSPAPLPRLLADPFDVRLHSASAHQKCSSICFRLVLCDAVSCLPPAACCCRSSLSCLYMFYSTGRRPCLRNSHRL